MYGSIDVKICSKTKNSFLVKAFSNPSLNYSFQTSVKGFIGVKYTCILQTYLVSCSKQNLHNQNVLLFHIYKIT